jgi:hypothetical protein
MKGFKNSPTAGTLRPKESDVSLHPLAGVFFCCGAAAMPLKSRRAGSVEQV